ncbi:MAG TPA: substrate-binding domain-containing protein [Planctomycetota bacterium]|nr:substrate-binding domain-containing protein [Planctomycetota bacterium]
MDQLIPVISEVEGELAPAAPVYQRLATKLRAAIVSRRLAPGFALPDERELASALKLSRGTVRKALETLIEEKLIVRQHGRGSFVAQPERLPSVPLCVIFEPGESLDATSYLGGVVQTMAQTAGKLGAELLLRDAWRGRPSVAPAAYLFIMPTHALPLLELANAGERVISVDMLTHHPQIDSIVYDNTGAFVDATRRLVEMQHRRIAFIDTFYQRGKQRVHNPNSAERRAGYRRALQAAGLSEMVSTLPLDADVIAAELPAFLREEQPTAIVAFDDSAAAGAARAVQSLGLEVPRDVSIVTILQQQSLKPQPYDWSGVVVSQQELSRKAVEHAMARIERSENCGGQVIKLPWTFHEGKTTAPPRHS